MTKLSKPLSRETAKIIKGTPVVITIAPCGAQSEARVGFRLKGQRTQYVALVSDLYRMAALWHGSKEAHAKRVARREGVPWRVAKRAFIRGNTI